MLESGLENISASNKSSTRSAQELEKDTNVIFAALEKNFSVSFGMPNSAYLTEETEPSILFSDNEEEAEKQLASTKKDIEDVSQLLTEASFMLGSLPPEAQEIIDSLSGKLAKLTGLSKDGLAEAKIKDAKSRRGLSVFLDIEKTLEKQISKISDPELKSDKSGDAPVEEKASANKNQKNEIVALSHELSSIVATINKDDIEKLIEQSNLTRAPKAEVSETIWNQALKSVEAIPESLNGSLELSFSDFSNQEPEERMILLFDLAAREIKNPSKRRPNKSKLKIMRSASRVLDNKHLKRVFNVFEKEATVEAQSDAHLSAISYFKITEETKDKIAIDIPATSAKKCFLGGIIDFTSSILLGILVGCFSFLPEDIANDFLSFKIPSSHALLPHFFDLVCLSYLLWIGISVALICGSGQSIGQKFVNTIVVDKEANVVGIRHAILRSLALSTTIFTFGLGLLHVLGKEKRNLHNFLADTYITDSETYNKIQLERIYGE